MDTIEIAVKWSNREMLRVYQVSGGSFDEMKAAIKAAGGKFDAKYERRWWLVPSANVKALKTAFSLKTFDFGIDMGNVVVFRPKGNDAGITLGQESREAAIALRDRLQAAYAKSDADFAAEIIACRAEGIFIHS